MKNKISELNELFDMFHDFEIKQLEFDNKTLTIRISIPWCEMWDIDEYILTLKITGCTKFNCVYFERTSTKLQKWEKGVYYPNEQKETIDTKLIGQMGLDIQNHEFLNPNKFSLNCNSSTSHENTIGQIDFGQLNFTASSYQTLDKSNSEIMLDQIKSWHQDWWNSIEKMHQENNRK